MVSRGYGCGEPGAARSVEQDESNAARTAVAPEAPRHADLFDRWGRDSAKAHHPFIRAAGGLVVAFVLDDGDDTEVDRWGSGLREAGAPEARVVVVSPERPPRISDLDGATGVYVAGGLTPAYREVLVDGGTDWLEPARVADLPYAGFSAGAAIAAVHALVGGCRTTFRERQIDVCHEDCAENLNAVTVLPGLGLVPFIVDVHAAQWGTHYRLVHAMLGAALNEGWAIDEHTTVEVADGAATIHGDGTATRARRVDDRIELSVHVAGDSIALGKLQ